ncbi:MAG TPA: SUMF1/EgtB/PvdO family nonheme iron enzyme, partial [Armatimonadota bacterium]|nr:SUMF1/EgtB/PvdO family nonheme iron enzyme [Armatimonadota bacterium]
MKHLLLPAVAGLLALLLAGCGERSSSVIADAGERGALTFTVTWPEADADSRAIPAATRRIVVTAKRQLAVLKEIIIARAAGQATATGTMTGLSPGPVTLYAHAYDINNALLASGASSASVISGRNTPATLTLGASGGGGGGTFGTRINPTDGAAMVWVPGGTFTMGSIDGVGESDERPAHPVTVTGYWIYQYPVTVAQYRAFCMATGRTLPNFPSAYGYSWADKTGWNDPAMQQHPIVNITWHDAKAYADWAGVSLPTEAQWEYAARGPEGRNYPWGGFATAIDPYNGWDQTKCANWYNSGSQGISTWPTGSFPAGASWCGAHDLAGNVWEWCADWWGSYSATPVTNPTGPATGTYRVLRGGSWNYDYYYDGGNCRGAYRYGSNPDNWGDGIGFRCLSLS